MKYVLSKKSVGLRSVPIVTPLTAVNAACHVKFRKKGKRWKIYFKKELFVI